MKIRLIIFVLFINVQVVYNQYYNDYVAVDSVYNFNSSNVDTLIIRDITFPANDSDIVLLHQSKGLEWNYSKESVVSDYGFTSRFSLHVIIKRMGNKIIIKNIDREGSITYKPSAGLQLVKVGHYSDLNKSITISSTIVPAPWDGEKGGIICIIADTIRLQANIDASGTGFRGASPVNSSSVICWANDSVNISKRNLPLSKANWAGLKGESVVNEDTNYVRGRAPQYNGGGGGSGFHSGGGGGANYFSGGNGGYEALFCASTLDTLGGFPGKGLGTGLLNQTAPIVVFGGGGGCSTQQNGYYASKGGNGGGIVIIMANVLIGNNMSITANGQSVTDTSTAGAGGGGAGGTIVLDVNEYLTKINIQLKGGNGGSVRAIAPIPGMGGGGAGGFLRINTNTISDSIIITNSGGNPGNTSPKINKNAQSGLSGFNRGNFIMPVKDFLFNLMPANQDICYGDVPKYIKASQPKGATNKYMYIWRISMDKTNWTVIDTATRVVFQPPALFDTTYFQRIVHALNDSNNIVVSDTSLIYTINVLPSISNNVISTDTTAVCNGLAMPTINGTVPIGGNNNYSYQWEAQTTTSTTWTNANGISDLINYKPSYTDTIKLRRKVISHVCKSYSNEITINVLPKIQNNIVRDSQWVSLGNIPEALTGNDVTGGDGSYIYLWQKSNNLQNWITIDSTTNNNALIIPMLASPDSVYYRRIILSGLFNTCKDTSVILPLYVLDSIHNNLIYGIDTICAGTIPDSFISSTPTGGDGNYTFIWQKSYDNIQWDSLTTVTTTIFNPGIIKQTTYFRRLVFSGRNNACKDSSNVIWVFTKDSIENNIIFHSTDTTICEGQTPDSLKASVPSKGDGPFLFEWEWKLNNNEFNTAPGNANNQNYLSPPLTDSVIIRRKVNSGICTSYSNEIKINVLPKLTNNIISADTTICKYSIPKIFNGSVPKGGDPADYRYLWLTSTNNSIYAVASGNNQNLNYQPTALDTITFFKRIVFSGPNNSCIDTSNHIQVNIYELPEAQLFTFNDSICLGESYQIPIEVKGQAPFNIKYTDLNAVFDTTIDAAKSFYWNIKPYTAGLFTYQLSEVIDKNGCSPKEIIGEGKLNVFKTPKAFAGVDTQVCGLEVKLHANTDVGVGTWYSSTNATYEKGENEPVNKATVTSYGTHQFLWKVNNGGCVDSSIIQVTFYQPPPNPLVGEDQKGPFLFNTRLKAYLPIFGQGYWTSSDTSIDIEDPTDPETKVEKLKFGKNYFQWYVKHGVCEAVSDTLTVEVTDIRIPEGFSPNGDGKNDTFEIKGLENVTNAELIILNRWGKEVFRSKDYKNDWNGEYKGNILPFDTYFYILNVIGRTYKGYLIIRK